MIELTEQAVSKVRALLRQKQPVRLNLSGLCMADRVTSRTGDISRFLTLIDAHRLQ